MKRPTVLLTNPIDSSGVRILEQKADVAVAPDVQPHTLRSIVCDADALIVRAQLPDDIFEHGTSRLWRSRELHCRSNDRLCPGGRGGKVVRIEYLAVAHVQHQRGRWRLTGRGISVRAIVVDA